MMSSRACAQSFLTAQYLECCRLISDIAQGRLDAAAAFERLVSSGRLQRPSAPPDRRPCVPAEVWAPAWPSLPAGSRPCLGGGNGRLCWTSVPAS